MAKVPQTKGCILYAFANVNTQNILHLQISMSAQMRYSQSKDTPAFLQNVLKDYAKSSTTSTQRCAMIANSSVAGLYYVSHLHEIAALMAPTIDSSRVGAADTILGSSSDEYPMPVLAGPEALYYAVGIAPSSEVSNSLHTSAPIDVNKLKETGFEKVKDPVAFLVPSVFPFQFGQQVIEGVRITDPNVRAAMVQSHGQIIEDWVNHLAIVMDKHDDIAKVLKNVDDEWWSTQFPVLRGESTKVHGRKEYPTVTVVPLPSTYNDEHLHLTSLYSPFINANKASPNSGVATAAPSSQVTYVTSQDANMTAKLKLGQTILIGFFLSGELDFDTGKVISLKHPVPNDATQHCLSQEGGLEVATTLIKSALDTAQVLDPGQDNKNIMMIYRTQADHDRVLIKNLLVGNLQKTPLSATNVGSSQVVGILNWAKETSDQMTNRQLLDCQGNAEDLAGDSATNKSKKRTSITLGVNIRSQKQVYEIMASFIQDNVCLFNMKNAPSIIYMIYNNLFDFLVEPSTMTWLEKHRQKMPAIWSWVASILDKVFAGLAAVAMDIRVVVPVQANNDQKLNEEQVRLLYQKVFKLYCNLKKHLEEAVDSDEPFIKCPDWAPESLRQPKSKKQNTGTSSSQSGASKANQGSMSSQLRFSSNGGGGKSSAKGGTRFGSKSGGGFGGAGAPQSSRGGDAGQTTQGTFVTKGGFNFVLQRSLVSKHCKFVHTHGSACFFGERCNFPHEEFKSWDSTHKEAQIAHVRANKDRMGFNKDLVSVDDIGAENADLLVDGSGNAGEN